ncbi:MAG: efflux RND transporter periplasmic adaptor subunit [Deltaproteobacteria bacterium]|nr:efflux RND transporter periplasmic adaptor subunit [Deltaproteobacteria bacterium]
MKRTLYAILLVSIGLAFGGAGVWLYIGQKGAPERQPVAKAGRKILYYRNPMNPKATSPLPQKDSMGMDFVPVYEDEAAQIKEAPGTVSISPEKIQKIGVRTEEVKRRDLKRVIRTIGRVEPVEDRIYIINAKVPGWIEKLYVNKTDDMVSPGALLLELFSPDLVAAQEEYLLALKALKDAADSPYPDARKGAESLLAASRQRLKFWDISNDQIERLKETGAVTRTMTIRAPSSGSVTDKMVVEGQKIEAGEPLFKIIDHSVVWAYAEIYEYEIPFITTGQKAVLYPSYTPTERYAGTIEHIYTHLGSIRYAPEEGMEARTAKVRFELKNPAHRLKLGMYLNIELAVDVAKNAVAAPESAVINTGRRSIVIVDKGEGRFEPREVMVGGQADGYYHIASGVKAGERVVTSGNFLIDSESNMRAAVAGMASNASGTAHKTDNEVSIKAKPARAGTDKGMGKKKILYYRNSMNPEITSPVPAKDSMGMDYIPVYEGGPGD